ncbi:10312_t:CDS:1, partial [Cetraspora pellucida]
LKGSILNTNNWPWNLSDLTIGDWPGSQFSVKNATDFLKTQLILPTAVQTPVDTSYPFT